MATIDQLLNKSTKKFKKSKYRAWNYLEEIEKETKKINNHSNENIENNLPSDSSSNREQTVSNALANREQTVSNTVSKPLANREQTVSNALAVREQTVSNALAVREQTVSNTVSKPLANREQNKTDFLALDINTLVGKERCFLMFVFEKCQDIGSMETPPITTNELKNILDISAEHLRNIVHRLFKKKFISKINVKYGKNGWRIFTLSKDVFQNISLNQSISKKVINREQCVSNTVSKPLAIPLANAPNSISNLLINNNGDDSKKNVKEEKALPEEWKNINCEPLKHIGFSQNQLRQLYFSNLSTPEIVQDSINHFSFGLKYNEKTKSYKNPLNMIMGVLRKGQAWVESDYEAPQDKTLRELLERKKKEKEDRENMYHELFSMEFNNWFASISDEELKQILPNANLAYGKYIGDVEDEARKYFRKKLWDNIYANLQQKLS